MFGNGRKTIGVFVSQLHQEFQQELCQGICDRAKEIGYNVACFTNFLVYGESAYDNGERNIAELPHYEDLDGIVLMPDSMFIHGFEKCIKDNIKKKCNCPVVSVRHKIEEYYNVLVDDSLVLNEVIRHFAEVHGFKRINYLSGPKNNPAARERLTAFRKIMKEYQLPLDESRIYHSKSWTSDACEAVKLWLSNPDKMPEAIICANDYIAISVCNALSERGIRIPEDIAVSGCDNINITQEFNPSITSVDVPIYNMGTRAVEIIFQHNEGISQQQNCYIKTTPVYRRSCGCNGTTVHSNSPKLNKNFIINEIEVRERAISNNAFMSINLTGVQRMEEFCRKLSSCTYMNEAFDSLYLCLFRDWDCYNDSNPCNHADKVMELGIKYGVELKKEEIPYPHLLPSKYIGEEPQFFFFNMLHYQERCFGYTAISFHSSRAYRISYQGWLINVCNALENIRVHTELNRLLYQLEDMSIKDGLTGLYNRRALELLGKRYLAQSIENQTKIMVFTADMDKLKYINDHFGHAAGDVAIKAVAKFLQHAAEDDEICMRIGGDEFVVIGLEYNDRKMERFLRSFKNKLEQYNKEKGCLFKLYVSCGWSILLPNENTTLEDCLMIADSKMYQKKYEKRTLRLKAESE